jgi:hypothetical protein
VEKMAEPGDGIARIKDDGVKIKVSYYYVTGETPSLEVTVDDGTFLDLEDLRGFIDQYQQGSDAPTVETQLEKRATELELLEKASALEKRYRKYKRCDPAETWATRWVACPIAYLFPAERREEWLGDLYETNREMLHKDYPQWFVSLNNIGRTAVLVFSALQIKLADFISQGLKSIK